MDVRGVKVGSEVRKTRMAEDSRQEQLQGGRLTS